MLFNISTECAIVNVKKILKYSIAYRSFLILVGGYRVYDTLVRDHIRPQKGIKILDIGCGPAHLLPWLPDADYTGVDISQHYIADARARFKAKGEFICGDVNSVAIPSAPYDVIIAMGLLHHLSNEEVVQLADRARQLLKPGGRLITVDGCYDPEQSRLARLALKNDRGDFVRNFSGYTQLVKPYFTSINTSVHHDMLRIPYTHLIMECNA